MADVEELLCNIVLISPAVCSLHPTGLHLFISFRPQKMLMATHLFSAIICLKRMSSPTPHPVLNIEIKSMAAFKF